MNKLKKIIGKRSNFHKGDITDSNILESMFSTCRIDTVMYFAALKSVAESKKYPDLYHKVNVEGTILLLNTVLKRDSKNQISYVIGKRREGDLDVSYADSDKIYQEIGFKTKYDIERMCEDGLRFVDL